jgi:hypothetical protein
VRAKGSRALFQAWNGEFFVGKKAPAISVGEWLTNLVVDRAKAMHRVDQTLAMRAMS